MDAGPDLIGQIRDICGADHVTTNASERAFFSSDLYQAGAMPIAVAAPANTEELADLVKLARTAGCRIHVRGGGMSYSNAFLPAQAGAILLDMRRLDKIRTIAPDDLYVTVETGATWRKLDEALAEHGLRSVFWGPASGMQATIGGSMSQGTANNQSGQIETSSNAVLGYEVITGSGDTIVTGLDAQPDHAPHFRPYGPDLTGLFNADAGALGIKTAVTLKLEPRPAAEGGVSFAFSSFAALRKALQSAGRLGIASAIIAMDSETAGIRSGASGLKADLEKLVTIVRTAHNPVRGLVRGVRIALAGRRVFETATYTAHFLAEGCDDATLVAAERALRRAVAPYGDEIPSAAISMIRAQLFPPLPTTDFAGRRMLPIHGILAWSRLAALHTAYTALVADHQAELDAVGVTLAEVFSGIGRGAVLFEPVFYWQDSLEPFHERTRPDALGPLDARYPDNPDARALVESLKTAIISLMAVHGAAHLQIGKLYPFMDQRQAGNGNLLATLKRALDPDYLINPGALGLSPGKDQ